MTKTDVVARLRFCAIPINERKDKRSCSICDLKDDQDPVVSCRVLLEEAANLLENDECIFNIPKKHIENLVEKKYPDRDEQRDIIQEECSELIQAVSKYKRWLVHPSLDEQPFTPIREHIVEELTHVAISLGILQHMLDITQDEINAEVKRKALESYFRLDEYPECFRDDAS